jgi:hypothetical protein
MHKTIKKLLNDGVEISTCYLNKFDDLLKSNPNLETDIINIHKIAKRYGVKWENVSVSGKDITYEMCVSDTKTADELLFAIDKVGLKSKNIMICVEAYDDCCFIFYHSNKTKKKK